MLTFYVKYANEYYKVKTGHKDLASIAFFQQYSLKCINPYVAAMKIFTPSEYKRIINI